MKKKIAILTQPLLLNYDGIIQNYLIVKKRNTYYDSLKGIAIVGVVFIHVLNYKQNIDFQIVFRQFINFSVPLFLAISGFFMVDTKINTFPEYLVFLKKRIPRVYYPYLVWSVVFIVLSYLLNGSISIKEQLIKLLTFQTNSIFYFVALIIQYYILFPVLKKYLGKKLVVFSLISSMVCTILLFLYQYISQKELPLIIYAGNFITWILFFVLGMYLKNNRIPIKRIYIFILTLLAFLASCFETYLRIDFGENIPNAVTAVKLSSFLYSACVIVLVLNFKLFNKPFLSDLGKVSYAVYLNHLLFLIILSIIFNYINISGDTLTSVISRGCLTLLTSYFFCNTIRKFNPKLANKYLGI